MKRGELFRVYKGTRRDPRKSRVFVIVSRQVLVDSKFSTVICAPVYSTRHGLSTQVDVGPEDGLKHDSSVYCDELVSLSRTRLTDFVGSLSSEKVNELNRALRIALEIE